MKTVGKIKGIIDKVTQDRIVIKTKEGGYINLAKRLFNKSFKVGDKVIYSVGQLNEKLYLDLEVVDD